MLFWCSNFQYLLCLQSIWFQTCLSHVHILDISKLYVVPWCSGYNYCKISFSKVWTRILRRFKSCSRRAEICDGENLRQWSRVEIRRKRLSLVNHSAKTIHHHHRRDFCTVRDITTLRWSIGNISHNYFEYWGIPVMINNWTPSWDHISLVLKHSDKTFKKNFIKKCKFRWQKNNSIDKKSHKIVSLDDKTSQTSVEKTQN